MASITSPNLESLITNVRNFLNSPNPANSFWTDEEITSYLNEGIRRYFLEVVQHNEGYFTIQTDLDITANQETVTLPTDCFQVKGLYKKVTNAYELLPYRNNVSESYSTQGGTSSESYLPSYYFRGNSLVLRPIPNFSETAGLRLEYIQLPDAMVQGTDTLNGQISPVFRQLIEMYAVYKAKTKESSVNNSNVHAVAQEQVADIAAQFRDAIANRSKNPTFVIPYNPESY